MSTESFQSILKSFAVFSNQFGIQPTFPVTATVVKRHPVIFQKLQATGVEFAVHGFRHVDYTQLSKENINKHYHQAIQIFKEHGLNPSGFRFPFLRRNTATLELLADSHMQWDSSEVVSWPFDKPGDLDISNWNSYLRILGTYQANSIEDVPSLPSKDNGLIEIPVSVPDDDILFERLKLRPSQAGRIWKNMLNDVREREELLTLQLHPERFPLFKRSLRSVILTAKHSGDCWIASLGQISRWWSEKSQFNCITKQRKRDEFLIEFICSDRGQPLVSMPSSSGRSVWIPCDKSLIIQSVKKPLIGLSSKSPDNLKKFLADEHIIFEITEDSESINLFIDWDEPFQNKDKRTLLNQILNCKYPLIRYGRWPKPYKYCLAITGDIDGIDLWDYWSRFHG